MPRYSYTAYDKTGARVTGELSAASREAALQALSRRGELPVVCAESRGGTSVPWWQREVFGAGELPIASLAMFTRELASLIKAELPLDETLRILAVQPLLPARLRAITERVLERVVEGEPLSGAIAAHGNAFPEFYARLVRAGEASGSLGDVMDDLAGFLERSAEARGQLMSALLYPAILLCAAALAIGVILAFLLPAIMPLFEEAGASPPWLIGGLAAMQGAVAGHWLAALAFLALVTAGLYAAAQNRTVRDAAAGFVLKVPGLGSLIERRESGRLARTLATLLKSGVPLLDAVRISGSALSNARFTAALQSAEAAIKEGAPLSEPLARSGLFSDLILRLTSIGEKTGQLDVMLARAATIYETAFQRQLQRLTALITPVFTVLIGSIVGGLILTVMSAIGAINDLALR